MNSFLSSLKSQLFVDEKVKWSNSKHGTDFPTQPREEQGLRDVSVKR